jgi:hypothetical protein
MKLQNQSKFNYKTKNILLSEVLNFAQAGKPDLFTYNTYRLLLPSSILF